MWDVSQSAGPRIRSISAMSARYYTHFVAAADEARHAREWSGVVELTRPLESATRGPSELRTLLAMNFEIEADDIKILQLSRVH